MQLRFAFFKTCSSKLAGYITSVAVLAAYLFHVYLYLSVTTGDWNADPQALIASGVFLLAITALPYALLAIGSLMANNFLSKLTIAFFTIGISTWDYKHFLNAQSEGKDAVAWYLVLGPILFLAIPSFVGLLLALAVREKNNRAKL